MNYTSNISQVVRARIASLNAIDGDKVARAMALAVLPELKKRVHVDGKASDGTQIGTYSNGYMKLRTGNYGNSARKSKGKDKGGLKDSGLFSRGAKQGQPRPSFNRTSDTKVIFSLTRQMENDLSVLPIGSKSYGIGYNNPINYDKSQYCETLYKKPVWKLSEAERTLAKTVAEEESKNLLAQKP